MTVDKKENKDNKISTELENGAEKTEIDLNREENNEINIPVCCGEEMKIGNRIGPFVVAKCNVCGDTVYIKCGKTKRPELISD